MDRYAYLCQFHPIPPADYALLEAKLRPRSFRKGEFIVVPGEVQRELYFVREGVQMSYAETDKKLHVIASPMRPAPVPCPNRLPPNSLPLIT